VCVESDAWLDADHPHCNPPLVRRRSKGRQGATAGSVSPPNALSHSKPRALNAQAESFWTRPRANPAPAGGAAGTRATGRSRTCRGAARPCSCARGTRRSSRGTRARAQVAPPGGVVHSVHAVDPLGFRQPARVLQLPLVHRSSSLTGEAAWAGRSRIHRGTRRAGSSPRGGFR